MENVKNCRFVPRESKEEEPNKYELMWKLLKRDLKEEYENAEDYYKRTHGKGWAGTYTAYLMALAMMKTLEDLDMKDLKDLE